MADEIDTSVAIQQAAVDRGLSAVRTAAASIPRGTPGECEGCCEDSPRLVLTDGLELCARCRDKRAARR